MNLASIIKYGIALALAMAGAFGAIHLLAEGVVGEVTFSFLIFASIFIGIWIAYSDRVKEFTLGLGKMSMVLSEMKETQRDVEVREARIKELAAVSADVVAHMAGLGGRLGSADSNRLNRLWLEVRFKRLAALTDSDVGGPAWRFIQKIRGLDDEIPEQKELIGKAWQEAYEEIRDELEDQPSARSRDAGDSG